MQNEIIIINDENIFIKMKNIMLKINIINT